MLRLFTNTVLSVRCKRLIFCLLIKIINSSGNVIPYKLKLKIEINKNNLFLIFS